MNIKKLSFANNITNRYDFCYCYTESKVYIHGGVTRNNTNNIISKKYFNDLWVMDLNKMSFDEILTNTGEQLLPPENFQATLNYYENNLYLFGGCIDNNWYLNTLWKYCLNKNEWEQLFPKESITKRAGHTTLIYKEYIILFGGHSFGVRANDFELKCFNDICLYNITKNKWKYIQTINSPSKRTFHSMILNNNQLIIYGGRNDKDKCILDSKCYIININDLLSNNDNNKIWISYDINIGYLNSHTMIYFDKKIIFFGGSNQNWKCNNNMIILYDSDIMFNEKQLSVVVNGYINEMEIYCGLVIPLLVRYTVQMFCGIIKSDCKIKEITPRFRNALCNVVIDKKKYVLVFGGENTSRDFTNDTYLIDISPLY